MAKNNLAVLLKNKYRQGVEEGWITALATTLLSGYNVSDKHFEDDEKYFEFFRDLEKECNRLFREECKADLENVPLAILHHTEELRKKAGLPALR